MPDFAPNVTPRYKLHYNVAGRIHTAMARCSRGLTFAQIQSNAAAHLRALFNALAIVLGDDLAFVSAEIALTDSDLFFPAAVPAAVVGLVAAATLSKMDGITHLTFSGRGSGGSKVNIKVFGTQVSPDLLPANAYSDFLLLGSEAAFIANAVVALNATPSLSVAIDNTVPVYANRATVKVNDFWIRRVRRGL